MWLSVGTVSRRREKQVREGMDGQRAASAESDYTRPSISNHQHIPSHPAHQHTTQTPYITWRRRWRWAWPTSPWRRQQQKVRAVNAPSNPTSLASPPLAAAFHLTHRHPPTYYNTADRENGDSGASKGMCAAPGCAKEATMACPKCLALKVAAELGTLFCSQVRMREIRTREEGRGQGRVKRRREKFVYSRRSHISY